MTGRQFRDDVVPAETVRFVAPRLTEDSKARNSNHAQPSVRLRPPGYCFRIPQTKNLRGGD
jgi:hypothetical protein